MKAIDIRENYLRTLDRIAKAARSVGRDADEVRLIVVTKGHTVDTARSAIQAGASCLGENYVEEAISKIQSLSGEKPVEWHMIGHIQSRKAQLACEYFDWVHSVDSLKLANRLDRFAGELSRRVPILIECNVSGETSKFGLPAWEEKEWNRFVEEIAPIVELPNIRVRGLMTMAPFLPDPEGTRPFFRRLRHLQTFLADCFPGTDWSTLSMGMSADYVVAIQEGATMVRIGTAILGERPI
jgi:hypothetical protein